MDTQIESSLEKIAKDRKRTNIFRSLEQPTIAFLCEIMPSFISPNLLTAIGFLGSVLVFYSFILAIQNPTYLLLGILGFAIQWFGDSLDGRVAYYRNIPKKWFGFALDMCMDWLSTIIIGIGFYYYLPVSHHIYVYTFITAYGWTMIIALLKYRITDKYEIDIEKFGPTELRIVLCLILLVEVIHPGVLYYVAIALNVILYTLNFIDFYHLLQMGNAKDAIENAQKNIQ